MMVAGLYVRVLTVDGELIRALTLNPTKDSRSPVLCDPLIEAEVLAPTRICAGPRGCLLAVRAYRVTGTHFTDDRSIFDRARLHADRPFDLAPEVALASIEEAIAHAAQRR